MSYRAHSADHADAQHTAVANAGSLEVVDLDSATFRDLVARTASKVGR